MHKEKNATRTQRTISSIISGLINRFVRLLSPFVMRTIIVRILGEQYLGLSSLYVSILDVLNLTELGIGAAIVYSMYKPVAEEDTESICRLLAFYKKCYHAIGFVVLGIGLVVLPFVPHLIEGEYPDAINIYYLYLIYLVNTVISYFMYAYKNALLSATQRTDVTNAASTIVGIIQFALQVVALLITYNYYWYAICLPISTVINNLLTAYLTNKLYPQYVCKGFIETEEKMGLFQNVKGLVYQKVGGVVLKSVDSVVISKFLGLAILARYENYILIINAIVSFLGILQSALIPSVGNSIVTEEKTKNLHDYRKFNFLMMMVCAWCSICLLCLFQPFMRLWMGEKRMLSDGMVILFAIYFFIHHWMDMTYVYLEAAGLWWERRYYTLMAAGVNLVSNVLLVNLIGLPGVLISTIISVLFVYDIADVHVLSKSYFGELSIKKEQALIQVRYLIKFLFVATIILLVCRLFSFGNVITLIIRAIVCVTLLPLLLLIVYRNEREFSEAKLFISAILKNRLGN